MDERQNGSSKSEALHTFEKNLDDTLRLIKVISEALAVRQAVDRFGELKNNPTQETVDALTAVVLSLTEGVRSLSFLCDWLLVMHVSFTETYLEDALTLLIRSNPSWMDTLTAKITYSQLSQAASLPAGMRAMQQQWQKSWVQSILKERPLHWIKRLERLGAEGYPVELGTEMDSVWSRRHSIVHRAGIKPHLSLSGLSAILNLIKSFIEPTDHFVVKFLDTRGV